MRKIVLAAALCSSFAFGVESENIIKGSAYGDTVVNENSLGQYSRENKKYYEKEVLYNYIILNNSLNQKPYEVDKEHAFRTVNLINKEVENKDENKKDDVAKDDSITVVGYCNVSDDIHIGVQPMSGYFDCNTNIGVIKIFGNVTPVNEVKSIIFNPQYIDYKKTRFKVLEGAKTTNEARTSYNIATFVNDRKISEIALGSTITSADTIKTSSHEYLRALEESKRKEQTDIYTSNNNIVPVTTKNTEEPNATDYIVKAGIDIVAGVVKTTAEVFKKDLPYLYEIAKNSKIYIDVKINKNGEIIK
jgi:hypothetical protein